MVRKWGEQRLFKFADADAYVRDMNRLTDEVRALLARCGTDRRPSMDDLTLYESWTLDFPRALIDYAADCARGMQLPMRYIDRLLDEWRKAGVTTVDEARSQHESRAGAKANPAANPALSYEQRSHTDDDYGDLFINLDTGNGGDGA